LTGTVPAGRIGHVSRLGTRVLRTEDSRFLTTGGVYTDDVADERLAGACYVHFVRSAVAHARITSVDVSGALAAPGVIAAFTGADPEHGVVCWVARRLGRPARWAETRNENLVGMTHGRAQRQTVTIGGRRDGTVTAYRLEILQDAGAYPRIGAFLPALTSYNPLGAKGIGEAGTIGSTPAVQNAIIDALAPLGVRHIDMPASPQRVWQALRAAATNG
jgi:CO/xanthine dehydrogenase Mo-binding subunit